jgi:site-specific DNA-methyltransferase (adenine-specific)
VIDLFNIDCMEYMKGLEDNAFELAIVDPPYGIGNFSRGMSEKRSPLVGLPPREDRSFDWNDEIPPDKYFTELSRVSEKQIIWGANFYNCFSGGAVVWYKGDQTKTVSHAEIASLSFQNKVDYIHINWQPGFYREKFGVQIHPCQKPVKLYEQLLSNYAKEGDKILDTHLGSGSSAIAAHYSGFDFVGCELDEDYYNAAKARFDAETAQVAMF